MKFDYEIQLNIGLSYKLLNGEDSAILNNSESNIYVFPRQEIYNKTLDYFLEGKFTENTIITNISYEEDTLI